MEKSKDLNSFLTFLLGCGMQGRFEHHLLLLAAMLMAGHAACALLMQFPMLDADQDWPSKTSINQWGFLKLSSSLP